MQFTSTWADYSSIRKESGPEWPTTIGEDPKEYTLQELVGWLF